MPSLRSWATPAIVGSFLIMALTGTLMFFHLDSGINKGLHEWAGMVMVVAGVAHLWLNWRPFMTYLRRPLATAIMGLGAVALGASFVVSGSEGGSPVGPVITSVSAAPIGTLAELTGTDAGMLVERLKAVGFEGASTTTTIAALTEGDRAAGARALSAVFATN